MREGSGGEGVRMDRASPIVEPVRAAAPLVYLETDYWDLLRLLPREQIM